MMPAPARQTLSLRLAALRALVATLVLPLALGGALPVLARALGGPAVHVCHCNTHATCGCPICSPELADHDHDRPLLYGECGDRDIAFGAALPPAVPPVAQLAIASPSVRVCAEPAAALAPTEVLLGPDVPPPRRA